MKTSGVRAATATTWPSFLLTGPELEAVKGRASAFSSVVAGCDSKLTTGPKPVASLNYGDHYGPGGESPSAGTDPIGGDAETVYYDGLCYQLTGDVKYAKHAQSFIDAWATTLKTVPTAQGKDDLNVYMPYMIGGATWVRGVNGWNDKPFTDLLSKVVVPNNLMSDPNNHGMWATLMVAAAGEYSHNPTRVSQARTRWEAILKGAVGSDGSLTREVTRSDTSNYNGGPTKGIKGLAYTHYFLEPAAMSAKLFADTGTPEWTTASGALLHKAFDRAASWTRNPQTFPYYASNNGKLIGVTNASYFPLLLKYYPNADAQAVVASGTITADGFLLTRLFS